MILTLYRIICAYMVFIILLNLFKSKDVRDKVVFAFMLIPLILRTFLIK